MDRTISWYFYPRDHSEGELGLSNFCSIFNGKVAVGGKNSLEINELVLKRKALKRFYCLDRAGIAHSAECLWDSSTLDPELEAQQCLCASTWIKTARLPCWLPRGQQVLYQRWIAVFNCMWATKHTIEGIHPGFKTHGGRHQKSKTGVSVAPQKWLMSSKKFLKRRMHSSRMRTVHCSGHLEKGCLPGGVHLHPPRQTPSRPRGKPPRQNSWHALVKTLLRTVKRTFYCLEKGWTEYEVVTVS